METPRAEMITVRATTVVEPARDKTIQVQVTDIKRAERKQSKFG